MRKIDWQAEKNFLIAVAVAFSASGLLIFDVIGAKNITFKTFWGALPQKENLYTFTSMLGVVIALFTILGIITRFYERL